MGLIEWIKEKAGKKQEFRLDVPPKIPIEYESLTQQMEKYGLTYIKEIDDMAKRKAEIKSSLDFWMEKYLRAEEKRKKINMKIAINGLYNLCQLEIMPYFRAIENEGMLRVARMFIFKYDINHNSPNAYGKLITYIRYMLVFFTKIDVKSQMTLVIKNTVPQPPNSLKRLTPAEQLNQKEKTPSRDPFPDRMKETI